jgi:hypothetical protein
MLPISERVGGEAVETVVTPVRPPLGNNLPQKLGQGKEQDLRVQMANTIRKADREAAVKIYNTGDDRRTQMENRNMHLAHRLEQDQLNLEDLTRAMKSDDSWSRRQRSKVYLHLVPLLALFYLVPSVQMVFMLQQAAQDSGGQQVSASLPWPIIPAPSSATATSAAPGPGDLSRTSTTSSVTPATSCTAWSSYSW